MKRKNIKKNLKIIVPIIILLIISLLDMYGASYISSLYKNALVKQTLWVLIGIIVFIIIYKIDMRILLKYSTHFYIIGIILLFLVLFFGKNVNGASSWFKIGDFSFQPSELFKFFLLLNLSKIVSTHKKGSIILLFKIITLTFIPALLIFLEPDTGVVISYLVMMMGVLLESKVSKKHIGALVGITFLCSILFLGFYFIEKDLFIKIFGTSFFYRIDRLLTFKTGSSYQLNNALIGVGASSFFGLGLKSSKIYIPEVTTDFVFDLSILNFGLIMGILIIIIYSYLLIVLYKEKERAHKYLTKTIISGIFYEMFFQVGEHILMNLGLTPITGITLPFLSYGGSSLISYFMLFALILKITTNNSSYN
jgi:rod shape determining protein RodA